MPAAPSLCVAIHQTVTARIFHAGFAIAVKLIDRFFQRGGSGRQRALVNRVSIRHVEMQRRRYLFNRFVAANHKLGIADGDFGVQSAGRSGGAENFDAAKRLLHKFD